MIGLAAPAPSTDAAMALSARKTPRILMTVDAVGGVWRYAMDLAKAMREEACSFVFAGFGPEPSPAQRTEAEGLGELVWLNAPLDWTTQSESGLDVIPAMLQGLIADHEIDLVHLNLPSQGAGLDTDVPVLVVSHSCVVTWFDAVRGTGLPSDWTWQERRNRDGFAAADAVLAPSQSHAAMLRRCYGGINGLAVVYNGHNSAQGSVLGKEPMVFAAGRWWDEGKNGLVLDKAAALTRWPVVMAGSVQGPNGQHTALRNADAKGELRHSEVMEWMRRAAIVASPSVYEPFGLAPLEAANSGAALVLADIPTYRELWDGAAAFADPHDPHAFAHAINSLAAEEGHRLELAAAGQERARRYSLAAQADAMKDVYQHLLQPTALIQRA